MFRGIAAFGDEAVMFYRDVMARLERLERGRRGQVSFDGPLQIEKVLIDVVPTGVGDHRDVVFTNLLTGDSYTISL